MSENKSTVPEAAPAAQRTDASPTSTATTHKTADDNASTASKKRRRKEEGNNGVKAGGKPEKQKTLGRRLFSACLCFRRPKHAEEDQQPTAREVDRPRDSAPEARVVTPLGKAHAPTKPAQADSGMEAPSVDTAAENEKANKAVKDEPAVEDKPAAVQPEKPAPSTSEKKDEKTTTAEQSVIEPEAAAEENKVANEKVQPAAEAAQTVSKAPITTTLQSPQQTVKPGDEAGPPPEAPFPPEPSLNETDAETVDEEEARAQRKVDAAQVALPPSSGSDRVSTHTAGSAEDEEAQPALKDGAVEQGAETKEQQRWLLPPIKPEFKGKKCLVLDLDETLVHSSFKVRHAKSWVKKLFANLF